MSNALIAACLWVVAATIVAFLPLRYQYAPGILLLLAAPAMIWTLAAAHGPVLALGAVFAVLSLFRRPLWHLLQKVSRS